MNTGKDGRCNMKKTAIFLLISLGWASAPWAGETLPLKSHPDTSGWQDLFGPDLSKAVSPKGVWSVRNGELSATEDKAIWSREEYEHFIVDLEFKLSPGSNSGLLVYASDIENWIPHSVEIQIADSFGQRPSNGNCASIYGHVAPKKQLAKKPGEWNRMTVACKDSMICVVFNGEPVAEMDMKQWTSAKKNPDGSTIPAHLSTPLAQLATNGHIGLQGAHGGKAKTYFRNVKVKRMD
jgi:hypothetical protein